MRVLIVDGYTDEPAGFGVPPYIDVYPRYVAGAVWSVDKSAEVRYVTIDEARRSWDEFLREAASYDLMVVIAGVTTPGKYLGGEPIRLGEILELGRVEGPVKVLGGPVARYGYAPGGGSTATHPGVFRRFYDVVATGDVDLVVYTLLRDGVERVRGSETHEDYSLVDRFAVLGARIVTQHPNYGRNLIAELETYRSCPRYVSGGCSFCATVRYGAVVYRKAEAVAAEVEALYAAGVKHFRLGRQADFYAYMALDTGKLDFPRPNVEAVERLLRGVRAAAPGLETLHIDNVNPGTVAYWPKESEEITKLLVEYGTPGNVAAMGIETADPRVVKLNNLKVMPEDALKALEIVHRVGSVRGWNGMPYILPGINFVLGLPGETRETYELNRRFLEEVLRRGILVRRVNIRQVMVLHGTPLWSRARKVMRIVERHKRWAKAFVRWVRRRFDHEMLMRVVPRGTVLRRVFTEAHYGEGTYARQPGSYPLLVYIPARVELGKYIDVVVVGHGFRSVIGVPYPLNVNRAPRRLLRYVPGMTRERLAEILAKRPFRSVEELRAAAGDSAQYLSLD